MSLATQQLLPRRQVPQLLPLPSFRRLLFTRLRRISCAPATSCKNPPPPEEPGHFAIHYLVNSCGLSSVEALRASKPLAHLRSTQKPDAVLRLLKQEGLDDAQIRRLVLSHPRVLVADAKDTLEPKIRALREGGFSGPELARLISTCPSVTRQRGVLPRIEFWRNLVGNDEKLFKAIEGSFSLLHFRLEEKVIPNLLFLRSLGITDEKIRTIVLRRPRLITSGMDRIRAAVEQVKGMGIPPDSTVFVEALYTVFFLRRSALDAKLEFLSSFGWSQAELMLAFRRFPRILGLSEKKIHSGMDFLKKAGCRPSYVASRSVLLGYSMERRLKPRYHVLQSLKMNGLHGGDVDLYGVMVLTEKKFMSKYVIPNTESIPELLESYLAAGAKSIPS